MAQSEYLATASRRPASATDATSGRGDVVLALATAALLAITIQVGLALNGVAPVAEGVFVDPDAYMRLVRVRELAEGGVWFDPVVARIAPPDGFASHWTRPLDVLLLLGAWIGAPLVGFESALFWWGAAISPLFQILALPVLAWAAAPLLARGALAPLAFFLIAQPGLFGRFMVGRPDHHGLLLLLLFFCLGFALRVLLRPEEARSARWVGLVSALSLWVSMESLAMAAIVFAAMAVFWVGGERRLLVAGRRAAVWLLFGAGVALLAERGPQGVFALEADRLSLAHVILLAAHALAWMGLELWQRSGRLPASALGRAAAGAGAAGLCGLLLAGFLPGFFTDPMASGDALYRRTHLANVEELQPLLAWPQGDEGIDAWLAALAKPLHWLGIALVAVPWLAGRLRTAAGGARRAWGLLAIGALVFLPLGFLQARWAPYPEALLLIPYAGAAAAALAWLSARLSGTGLALVRPLVVVAFCIWIYLPPALVGGGKEASASVSAAATCPLQELAPVLDDPEGLGRTPKRILALIDFGPELLYRTGHSIFAIPNHKPQPAYATSYRVMTADDPEVARRGLARLGADLVLICPGSAEDWFYDTGGRDGPTLYRRLQKGAPPAFLVPIELPDPLGRHFRLFEVRGVSDRESGAAGRGGETIEN